jgi:hypothetical protein
METAIRPDHNETMFYVNAMHNRATLYHLPPASWIQRALVSLRLEAVNFCSFPSLSRVVVELILTAN